MSGILNAIDRKYERTMMSRKLFSTRKSNTCCPDRRVNRNRTLLPIYKNQSSNQSINRTFPSSQSHKGRPGQFNAVFLDPINESFHSQNISCNTTNKSVLTTTSQTPNDCSKTTALCSQTHSSHQMIVPKIIINQVRNPSDRIRKLSDGIAKLM